MRILSQIFSIILLLNSALSLAAEPSGQGASQDPVLTRERVGAAANLSFWVSYAFQNGAYRTMNQLQSEMLEQKRKLLEAEYSGKTDTQIAKKYQINVTQYNRALLTNKIASAANAVSMLGVLSQMAFPPSQESRVKEIYCEKNPNYSPKNTGEGRVVCRAIELDDHHKEAENVASYRPDVPYRNEYVRPERSEREDRTSMRSGSAR